jgi:hypothetical protein
MFFGLASLVHIIVFSSNGEQNVMRSHFRVIVSNLRLLPELVQIPACGKGKIIVSLCFNGYFTLLLMALRAGSLTVSLRRGY